MSNVLFVRFLAVPQSIGVTGASHLPFLGVQHTMKVPIDLYFHEMMQPHPKEILTIKSLLLE